MCEVYYYSVNLTSALPFFFKVSYGFEICGAAHPHLYCLRLMIDMEPYHHTAIPPSLIILLYHGSSVSVSVSCCLSVIAPISSAHEHRHCNEQSPPSGRGVVRDGGE